MITIEPTRTLRVIDKKNSFFFSFSGIAVVDIESPRFPFLGTGLEEIESLLFKVDKPELPLFLSFVHGLPLDGPFTL